VARTSKKNGKAVARTPADAAPKKPKKPGRFAPLIAKVTALYPVRVFTQYSGLQGPLLASGLAYQAIFASFAAIWVGFSVAGLIVAGDTGLQQSLISTLQESVPGLIQDSRGNGAIDPKILLSAGIFGLTGAIALVGLLVTALGWLASARSAIRVMFALPAPTTNFALLKLKDLGLAVAFGIALVISSLLSVGGSAATGFLLDLLGIDSKSVFATIVGRVVTLAVMFALDAVVLGALYRVLSGIPIPWRRLRSGVLVGALGLGVLKVLGSALLGGSKSNPLLASFAVIIGLLIFFNLICQVILIAASWIAVAMKDAAVIADREAEAARLAAATTALKKNGGRRRSFLGALFGRRSSVGGSR
jgi:membrane protein